LKKYALAVYRVRANSVNQRMERGAGCAKVQIKAGFPGRMDGIHSMISAPGLHTYALVLYIYALAARWASRRKVYERSTPQCDS
jgi:hypothetical protein